MVVSYFNKTLTLLCLSITLIALLIGSGCSHPLPYAQKSTVPIEPYLRNVTPLTLEGWNTEASWSFDNKWITFQRESTKTSNCNQTFRIRENGKEIQQLSKENGHTLSSFFFPNQERILWSYSDDACEQKREEPYFQFSKRLRIFPNYHIFGYLTDGSDPIPLEPAAPRAYHAETKICQDNSVVFTSNRNGHFEIYKATLQRFGVFKNVEKIHAGPRFNGSPSFSPDCKKIVWLASKEAISQELNIKAKNKPVSIKSLEIWISQLDGSDPRPVTSLGAIIKNPVFTPDGKHILFSADLDPTRKNQFDLYWLDIKGGKPLKITELGSLNGFAAFSLDGKKLAFSSNRNVQSQKELNIFIADWVSPSQ